MSSQEAFKQDIERQLSAFEEREKQFRARERQERLMELMRFIPQLQGNEMTR